MIRKGSFQLSVKTRIHRPFVASGLAPNVKETHRPSVASENRDRGAAGVEELGCGGAGARRSFVMKANVAGKLRRYTSFRSSIISGQFSGPCL